MNPIRSSIKRFVMRLSVAILLVLAINLLFVGIYIYRHQKTVSDEMAIIPLLKQFPQELVLKDNQYYLNSNMQNELEKQDMWAMLLDDRQGTVLWSYKLPEEIPTHYTLSDVAALSRYYLKDYPVSTWKHPDGLIVVGSPKYSLWKIAYMFPYSELKAMPGRIMLIIACDLLILFLLYFIIDSKSFKAVSNVLSGIQSLAEGKLIQLKEKGTFSEIATQLNKTSDLLKTRAIAQENWIAGISHDIRTPLSVILGYAEKIEVNSLLPKDVQEKASLIKFQGIRLRDLVNDLNLITRLEDESHPIHLELFHPTVFGRELIAKFLNNGIPEKYSVEFDIDKELESIKLKGNTHLLQRAINNLLYNSIRHNPMGCTILFRLCRKDEQVLFIVSDNGKGMTLDEIAALENRSHYISQSNTDSSFNAQHGLGLYIVQQIVKIHNGNITFCKSESEGFEATIRLSVYDIDKE